MRQWQSDSFCEPSLEVLLDEQALHSVAAVTFEYLPSWHLEHIDFPVPAWKVPPAQLTQAAAAEAPVFTLNLPAAHSVHFVVLKASE
jgi:hypothetical protein